MHVVDKSKAVCLKSGMDKRLQSNLKSVGSVILGIVCVMNISLIFTAFLEWKRSIIVKIYKLKVYIFF